MTFWKNSSCPILLFGSSRSHRIRAFQSALRAAGLPPAEVRTYQSVLEGTCPSVQSGRIVRLESPARDFDLEKRLIALGGGSPVSVEALAGGAILHPGAWFRGFERLLQTVFELVPTDRLTQCRHEILAMFDKRVCSARLSARGIPVPPVLSPSRAGDEIVHSASTRGAFLKLFCGSSASGMLAYDRAGFAFTTMQWRGNTFVNNRRVQRVSCKTSLKRMIEYLQGQGLHAEEWIPKARLGGRPFDLRVVLIDGEPEHCVLRVGKSVFTNLILGGRRESLERLPPGADPERIREICREVARAFPKAFTCGVDLLLRREDLQPVVIEVNAFGDLLPGLLHRGMDTYGLTIHKLRRRFAL